MVIGILGFGTIGVGVYDILKGLPGAKVKYVLDLREVGVPELTHRFEDILEDPEVDTVIEVMGGLHPSFEFASAAMKAGKNLVTANKFLVATFYDELTKLAKEYNVAFRATASVGGGIGWLTALENAKRIDRIHSMRGIMNGTTNYILSNMTEAGVSFETALSEAQALGYAEADPSADIDGKDVLQKVMLSANVAFDVSLKAEEIPIFGIRHISAADIEGFKAAGMVCKLLGNAAARDGKIAAYVIPTVMSKNALFGAVSSNFNMISYEAEYAGPMSFYGQGAGRYPTASNVVKDCADIMAGVKAFYAENKGYAPVKNEIAEYRFYLRSTAPAAAALANETLGAGVVTAKMTVAELTKAMEQIQKEDPAAFVAAVLE